MGDKEVIITFLSLSFRTFGIKLLGGCRMFKEKATKEEINAAMFCVGIGMVIFALVLEGWL